MPDMEMFRRRQKWVFWGVAILVIPSFALVWGVGGNPNRGFTDPDMLVISGKTFSQSDYFNFRKRFLAASGRMYDGSQSSILMAMAYVQLAWDAGMTISPLEEGTFLRREHPILANAADDEAFRRMFQEECTKFELAPEEFRQGVREWLAVHRLWKLDNQLQRPAEDTTFARYAITRAEVTGTRVRFPVTEEIRERGRAAFAALSEEEQKAELRRVAHAREADDRFREPARYRFEYLLVTYASYPADRLTDDDVQRFYDQNRARYQPRTFEDAKEDVRADAFQDARRRNAASVVRTTVDSMLARSLREEGAVSLDELAKQRSLVRAEVQAGVSGPEPMSVAELEASGLFAPDFDDADASAPSVAALLAEFDRLPEDRRAERLTRWKRDFDTGTPAASAQGRLRLRLLDYVPSEPAVEDAEGRLPPAVAEAARGEWVREFVDEAIRDDALAAALAIRAGDASALEAGEAMTWAYAGQFPSALWDVPVGGVTEPLPFRDGEATGVELLAVTGRNAPSRDDWAAEDPFMRRQYQNAATQDFIGRPVRTAGMTMVFQPSAFYQAWLMDQARDGKVWFAPTPDGAY